MCIRDRYHGAVEADHYGRQIPKQAHGSINLDEHTSSTRKIMCACLLYTSTRLQMQSYVCIADFVYMQDKYGRPYGWGVAAVSYTHLVVCRSGLCAVIVVVDCNKANTEAGENLLDEIGRASCRERV